MGRVHVNGPVSSVSRELGLKSYSCMYVALFKCHKLLSNHTLLCIDHVTVQIIRTTHAHVYIGKQLILGFPCISKCGIFKEFVNNS